MPGVTIVVHILPIAIVIEVVDPRHIVADIVVAIVIARRIVIVRIVQISVIAAIAAVVPARITIAVIVVDYSACLVGIHTRQGRTGSAGTRQSKRLALFNRAAAALTDKLRATA